MDPQACWNRIIGGDDRDDIIEAASALLEWIGRGGFKPKALNSRGEPLPDDFRLQVGGIVFFRTGRDGPGGLIDVRLE